MKSRNLIKLREHKIRIPTFKVLTFDQLIHNSQMLINIIKEGEPFDNVRDYIIHNFHVDVNAIDGLSSKIAVRSDCSLEDDKQLSFAGVFDSFLHVDKREAADYIKKCLLSLYSKKTMEYVSLHSIDISDLKMNVILQDMVVGEISGVIFTSNPQGILNESVITVARSTCDVVVEDRVDTTTYYYNNTDKTYYFTGKDDMLSGELIHDILTIVHRVQKVLEEELLDIEFTISNGTIYILQARPITSIDTSTIYVYDNSNIVESYPNITLPLTVSFAKEIYTGVFKGVARRMLSNDKAMRKLDHILENMVGEKIGRMYYRIDNWYDVLQVLPFHKKIIPVWQDMLGVTNTDYKKNVVDISVFDRFRVYYNFFCAIKNSPKNMKKLNETFIDIYEKFRVKINHNLTPKELKDLYMEIGGALFDIWDLTLINDMYAFIFTGLLKKRMKRQYKDDYEQRVSDMISGVINIESIKPITSIINLVELYHSGDNEGYKKAFDEHIDTYGDRVVEELKLETKTFRTNPELLEQLIIEYSANMDKLNQLNKEATPSDTGSFNGYFAKRALLGIQLREQSRLNRSKIFGMVRSIIHKISIDFTQRGILKDPDDIFYLTLSEVFSIIDKPFDVEKRIVDRKKAYEVYHELPEYSRLVITNDTVDKRHFNSNNKVHRNSNKDSLIGTVCSTGKVIGEALVIKKPSDAKHVAGKIIIAKMTDPGWVYIIASSIGIITQKGSILSHTAIVSRELGIPAIVGVDNVTDVIKTGDRVVLDADRGIVEVIR